MCHAREFRFSPGDEKPLKGFMMEITLPDFALYKVNANNSGNDEEEWGKIVVRREIYYVLSKIQINFESDTYNRTGNISETSNDKSVHVYKELVVIEYFSCTRHFSNPYMFCVNSQNHPMK